MSKVEEAIGAYWRSRQRRGDMIIDQPSQHSDVVDDNRIILTNCRGYLATYHLQSQRVTWSGRDERHVERTMYP